MFKLIFVIKVSPQVLDKLDELEEKIGVYNFKLLTEYLNSTDAVLNIEEFVKNNYPHEMGITKNKQ